ncbi:MAG: nucleoside triphosphate pyrophosphatase [Spirochaetales bacterium]
MTDSAPLLLLASTSPRREALLATLGIPFRVVTNPWQEVPLPREKPTAQARRLSREKAMHFATAHPENSLPVLTADTLISFRGRALNKPTDSDQALQWYRELSGHHHQVLTAVTLWLPTRRLATRVVLTSIRFLPWNEGLYRGYLETGEWEGVAGGYRVQESGICLVDRIHGSWSNVVGLPLAEVYGILSRHLPIPGRQ